MRQLGPAPLWLPVESDAPTRRTREDLVPWIVLALFTLAFAALFSWLSVDRHLAYQSHAFDLGNMDQAVWNTLHGRPLRFTDMAVGTHELTTRLAIHVEPLLLLLAPLYLLHSGPETLLVLQACVVALGAVPAYMLARDVLGRPWLSLVFPLAYLLHPSLQNLAQDDFHAVALSACFLMWALLWAYRSALIPYAVFAVLAMTTKEEIGLVVAMIGLGFLFRRRVLVAILSVVGGVLWFVLSVAVIIPRFNPAGASPYLGRYAYLGHGLGGIVGGIVLHPHRLLDVLTLVSRVEYLDALLHPLGFVSLLGLPVLLLALPSLAINMLSADPTMYSGLYQYSAEIMPIVIAAAIAGTAVVARVGELGLATGARFLPAVVAGLVLVASLVDSRQYGFTPLADGYLVPSVGSHQRLENRILTTIPAGAPVAAADEIEPHLSDRAWAYLLPTIRPSNGPPANYIVLDASIPSLPVEPHTLRRVTERALRSGYGIVAARDGVLLLRRGATVRRLPPAFFTFAFSTPKHMEAREARWGPLRLAGIVLHPASGRLNRSRPAISLESYWRVDHPLPSGAHIAVYLSPVYHGARPRASPLWRGAGDSPTWSWMPLATWPVGRTIHAVSLPLLPAITAGGQVDVAIGVRGLGPASLHGTARVAGEARWVRVGSVTIDAVSLLARLGGSS